MDQLREEREKENRSPAVFSGLGIAEMTPDQIRQARLEHYATTCPITLSECVKVAQLEPGENLMDAFAQLRWEYARKMVEQGELHELP